MALCTGSPTISTRIATPRRSAPTPTTAMLEAKILAWRAISDQELTDMVEAAAKEMDSAKRVAMYERCSALAQERAPFVMLLQAISSGVAGQGRIGLRHRPAARLTPRYYGIRRGMSGVGRPATCCDRSSILVTLLRPAPGHLPDRPGDADRSGARDRGRPRADRDLRRRCAASWASTSRCRCSSGAICAECCTAISAGRC